MLYEWRRYEKAPIVNVLCMKEEKQIVKGSIKIKNVVKAEIIIARLL